MSDDCKVKNCYYRAVYERHFPAITERQAHNSEPEPAGPVGVEPLVGAREAGPTRDNDTGSQPRLIGARESVSQIERRCHYCDKKLDDHEIVLCKHIKFK